MSSQRRSLLIAGLLLVAACLAVYGWSLGFSFIELDDPTHIFRNKLLNPPSFTNLFWFWQNTYFGMYIPMTYSLWSLVAMAAGSSVEGHFELNPHFFHAINLLLHIINALLVFSLLRFLLGRIHPQIRSREKSRYVEGQFLNDDDLAALAGALLFAWHPVQVEAIGWLSGMRDLLAVCLALVFMRFYYGYLSLRRGEVIAKKRADASFSRAGAETSLVYLATLSLLLSLLSKPTTALVPYLVFILDVAVLGLAWRGTLKRLLPWMIMGVPFLFVAKLMQPDAGIYKVAPVWFRPFVAGDAVFFYIQKLLVPFWSTFDYGRAPRLIMEHWWGFCTWMIPAVATLFAWRARKRSPWILATAAVAVLALFPVLGLVPFDFQMFSTVTDHYLYLPMFGISLGFACALRKLMESPHRSTAATMAALWLLLLGGVSAIQIGYWKDGITLFTHSIDHTPDSMISRTNLAATYFDNGNYSAAIENYTRAAELRPDLPEIHLALGACYLLAHNPTQAVIEYRLTVEARPELVPAHLQLGTALMQIGKKREAVDQFQEAVRLAPDDAGAKQLLATAIAEAARSPERDVSNSPDKSN